MPDRVPWSELDALFFDAGNTLVGMDFELIAAQLRALGHACAPAALARAEAAARPAVSDRVGSGASTEGRDVLAFYMERTFGPLLALEPDASGRLSRELVARLRRPGMTERLWSAVLPGIPESLDALRGAGLRLVVVSNSDGSIERMLGELGLRDRFDAVLDSAVVGVEKPDPRIFRHALERAGAAPERTAHVGDLYSVDVAGARAAGIHPVLVDPHGDWGAVDCATVSDVGDLARRVLGARGTAGA